MPGPGNVGERVRNLRLARRMSQAQLAGHDLSDSYISLIESGKRTPTPAVLRLLAERLGCTAEYLAEGIEPEQRAHLEVRERYARLALRTGDAAAALAGFDEVISGSDDPGLTLRARWGRARALEALGRFETAIGVFEEMREHAERDSGRSSALPALVALARCYRAVGDLGQGIALAERVLARLRDLELNAGEEHTEAARVLLLAYVDRAELDRAHELGRRVLSVRAPSAAELAAAYHRASGRALEQGAVGDALYLADQALAARDETACLRAQARLHLAAARALLRGVRPFGDAPHPAAEAMGLLSGAAVNLDGAEAVECAIETARALVLLGEPARAIETVEREPALAEAVGQHGNGRAEDPGPDAAPQFDVRSLQVVQARLIIARAHLAMGARDTAVTVLQGTFAALDRLGGRAPARPVAHLLRELGELFESAGDPAGATTAYRRALQVVGLQPSFRSASFDSPVTSDATLPTAP
ncbi:helix-turn-helix domain-containing protein [Thermomonospora catenispora]|uniref:helix-turn-helix domain-containing protein n=1 Tax=Thermomonospora catenispora TaxID=2493090 RepID=UPI00111D1A1B|nr:helix-turn-helix domain-containing protein [Thermomonospora catenispora]TNY37686.1 helix-turn-helix domain-containing protein [Thermomonospora catenispora]